MTPQPGRVQDCPTWHHPTGIYHFTQCWSRDWAALVMLPNSQQLHPAGCEGVNLILLELGVVLPHSVHRQILQISS